MGKGRLLMLAVLVACIAAYFTLDLGDYFTLAWLKSSHEQLQQLQAKQPLVVAAGFFLLYVLVTSLSLPGGALMTLAAGALFGLVWGTVIVSFASSIGATLAMLLARFIFREQVAHRFERQLARIDAGMARDGPWFLFSLRLVPLFPFFAINLAMGLTNITVPVYYLVSQAGMLAGTLVYVNAGTQLAQISSLGDILSFDLLASFTLLGVFPLIAKKLVDGVRAGRMLRRFDKPKAFDCDAVVIGAGSGGLVAALIVATVNGKVTLIEKHKMGGDCLNTGCVPSKTLLRSARLAADMARSPDYGIRPAPVDVDFAAVMQRVQAAIKTIEPHDSVERYQSLGVDVELGEAQVISPWCVEVGGKRITTRNIIVATGATPFVPPIDGLDQVDYLTSDNLWSLETRPGRLVVLGGGPIGCELAQGFARLGSQVFLVEALPGILNREDEEVSTLVADCLAADGVTLLTGFKAKAVLVEGSERFLVLHHEETGNETRVGFDELLVAVGRKPTSRGFGLEDLGVELADSGHVRVDDYLRTNIPNIYAIGDVAGPYQFTHTASHMAWFAAVNALFGTFWKFRVDYSVIPWCTFTSPEVAHVGINEAEARSQGMEYEVTRYDIGELDRAIAEGEQRGFVKVITPKGKDTILGVTIVAEQAGELISEYVLAMKHKLGLGKILGTIHIYPTMAEANKFAASEWRKAHKPERLLSWLGRYFRWRRGGP